MPTITELRDLRTKLLTDAQALLVQDDNTAENRTQADKMLKDVETLESTIEQRERIEAKLKEERSHNKPPRSAEKADASKDAEARYSKAFGDYIRFGEKRMSAESREALYERRDLLTTNSSDAYLIPQQFNPTLIEAQKFIGAAVSIVNKKITNNNGAPMRFSLVNDTANILTTMTEGTSLSDTDPSFTGFIVQTDTVATLIKASKQELADSYFDLDTWIKKCFSVRYARGLDQYVINGNSSNVASLVSGATLGATAAAASGPVYDDFVAVYGNLDEAYLPNSKWLMSQKSRAFLLGQKDSYGRPFWNVSPTAAPWITSSASR